MSQELTSNEKNALLKRRAKMLAKSRAFFEERNILEVDCPALSKYSAIDVHIDPMETDWGNGKKSYLHTSPEYHMKRLIADGIGDIYQMSHVFRKEEMGDFHHPEFTLVEWYQKDVSFQQFIHITIEYVKLFLENAFPIIEKTYREIFFEGLQVDPFSSKETILAHLKKQNISLPQDHNEYDLDTLLAYLLTHHIEPKMNKEALFIVKEYPASQAALSQVIEKDGLKVAERFEIYHQGIELANGYHELTDSIEQRRRFESTNEKRKELNKDPLPIDEPFIKALEKGLGDCCGVAVGFDRLMMLQQKQTSIHNILP